MPAFIPGLQLAEEYYREIVGPILDREFPGLVYAAALIGYGSDVLAYDTERSTDHGWGPRCWLFLPDADLAEYQSRIDAALQSHLPRMFRGYPTRFSRGAATVGGPEGPIRHFVLLGSLPGYFVHSLGFDPLDEIGTVDWLLCPQQQLLEVTRGAVFHDGFGVLTAARERLMWYPDGIWRALLAAQWQRISQEEAFVGRCAEVGDELGSSVVAARLVRDLMRLAFLMERTCAPYSKWYGTAFAHLACAAALLPLLTAVMHATTYSERAPHLAAAYETVAEMHNALGITPPLDPRAGHYHGRPFTDHEGRPFIVIHAERFAQAIRATIADDMLRKVASFIGGIDQFADSTDLAGSTARREGLRMLYATSA
jgi:hypothetical protein